MSAPFLRPMLPADMDAVARLQDACYPPVLRDSPEALRSRIDLSGHACVVAIVADGLAGYILAHPWPSMSPPKPDMILTPPREGQLVHYIHDLSVDPRGRALRLGGKLIAESQAIAIRHGMLRSELTAIDGAEAFWRARGYEAMDIDEKLKATLRSYGATARYMARDLA